MLKDWKMMKYFSTVGFLLLFLNWYNVESAFVPKGYLLNVHTDFVNHVVKGEVDIVVTADAEDVRIIQLNLDPTVDVNYKAITVKEIIDIFDSNDYTNRSSLRWINLETVERTFFEPTLLKVHLKEKIKLGSLYVVRINFHSDLSKSTNRKPLFMKSFIENGTNIERKLMIMDFTDKGCSAILPCFDDPKYKTWYQLSVTCPPSYFAVSTTALLSAEHINDDDVKLTFDRTPPMSSNALALIVANTGKVYQAVATDEPISDSYFHGIEFNIKYDETFLTYLLKQSGNILFTYPLPFLNFVFLPGNFGVKTINSFGLIIINEGHIYPEENTDSPYDSFLFAMFVVNDMINLISEQWLKFLVTPLSNSLVPSAFSEYMSGIILENLSLQTDGWTKELFSTEWRAFNEITFSSWNLVQNSTRFEVKKGVLIFSMLAEMFGKEAVMHAVKSTLHARLFKTYTDDNIWSTLNEIVLRDNGLALDRIPSPKSVNEIIASWMRVKPVPLITVYNRYKTKEITIDQEPYIYARKQYDLRNATVSAENFHNKWWVLIKVMKLNDSDTGLIDFNTTSVAQYWVQLPNSVFDISMEPDQYIIVNPSISGPFVINYDVRNWNMILKHFSDLPVDVMTKLLMEATSLTKIGRLDVEMLLDMASKIKYSPEYKWPIVIVINSVQPYIMSLCHGELSQKYKKYFSDSIKLMYNGLFGDHTEKERQLPGYIWPCFEVDILCSDNYFKNCDLSKDYKKFTSEAKAGANFTGQYCAVVKKATYYEWMDLANSIMFNALPKYSESMRVTALRTLACTENDLALDMLLTMIFLQPNRPGFSITDHDRKAVLGVVPYSHAGSKALLSLMKNYFTVLRNRLSGEILDELLKNMVNSLKTEDDYEELIQFYTEHKGQFGSSEEMMKNSIEKFELELNWYKVNYPKLEHWISSRVNSLTEQRK